MKGRLQPTRTLGDYYLKKEQEWKGKGPFRGPYLTAEPVINVIRKKQEFIRIIVASDGIWDFLDKWTVAVAS